MNTAWPQNVPMVSREGTIRSVVWRDVLPCVLLFRTLRVSFRVPVLLLAFGGYLVTVLGGWLIGEFVFAGVEDPLVDRWHRELLEPVWSSGADALSGAAQVEVRQGPDGVSLLPAGRGDFFSAGASMSPAHGATAFVQSGAGIPAAGWWFLAAPVIRLFHPDLSSAGLGYLLLRNAWNVLVWAFFGGAIARIAAFELTRRETVGLERASSQAAVQFPSHLMAPLIAAAAIFLAALPLVVAGLLMRLEFLAWVAGILWIAILLFGLLLAVLAIGLLVGWPLMWSAVAVEQSDAFDAVSRAYAYVYQRPLHLACYVIVIAVLGMLGGAVITLFAAGTIYFADWAVGWGSGEELLAGLQGTGARAVEEDSWIPGASAGRSLWTRMVLALAAAYPIGFLWCAAVGIYLLLRWHVDGAQTDEIADDELEVPTRLPTLKPHESGIPEVEPRPSEAGTQRTPPRE